MFSGVAHQMYIVEIIEESLYVPLNKRYCIVYVKRIYHFLFTWIYIYNGVAWKWNVHLLVVCKYVRRTQGLGKSQKGAAALVSVRRAEILLSFKTNISFSFRGEREMETSRKIHFNILTANDAYWQIAVQ